MKAIFVTILLFLILTMPAHADGPRKGLALACGGWDDTQPATGATWVMDWGHYTPSFHAYGDAYVPMIRGWTDYSMDYPTTNWDTPIMVYSQAMTWRGRHWLLGNEPNDASQDNYTPPEAVHVYSSMGRFITWADPTSKLLLGGISYGDTAYMDQMLMLWPTDVPLAGLQWHVYVWGVNVDDAINKAKAQIDLYVDYTHSHNPDWEVWITEYGMLLADSWFTTEDNARFIREVTAYLDERVDGYAFFTWTDDCMPFQSICLADDTLYAEAFRGN